MSKSEDNNELPRSTGSCRFCGQQRIIKTIGEITQEKADEIATNECDCQEAKVYQNRASKIKKAREWADNRFMGHETVTSLFYEAFDRIVNHDVDKISIKDGDWTHNVFLDSDGYLTIKSGKKVDEEVNFS